MLGRILMLGAANTALPAHEYVASAEMGGRVRLDFFELSVLQLVDFCSFDQRVTHLYSLNHGAWSFESR